LDLAKQSFHRVVAQVELVTELSNDVSRILVRVNSNFLGVLSIQFHLEHANGLRFVHLGGSGVSGGSLARLNWWLEVSCLRHGLLWLIDIGIGHPGLSLSSKLRLSGVGHWLHKRLLALAILLPSDGPWSPVAGLRPVLVIGHWLEGKVIPLLLKFHLSWVSSLASLPLGVLFRSPLAKTRGAGSHLERLLVQLWPVWVRLILILLLLNGVHSHLILSFPGLHALSVQELRS
jgi:hypothetical protein